jgi:hypothetical protein
MVSTITRDDANQILSKGYPTKEKLKNFPLSELLIQIHDVDPRYGKQRGSKPGHIERTIKGINILLSDNPENICAKWVGKKSSNETYIFEAAYQKIFHGNDEKAFCRYEFNSVVKPFLRLIALYHDIGKSIITERHSIVGWHLIADVYSEEVRDKLFPLILGKDQVEWENKLRKANNKVVKITNYKEQRLLKIFISVIKYHEYFGILSTGEGSLPIMLDLIDLIGIDPDYAKELFSILMIITLADVYGSVPEVLPQKVEIFCKDWEKLCNFISRTDIAGDREKFYEALREESQKPKTTIDRLWRLMYEAAPLEWRSEINHSTVLDIFKEVTLSRMYPFMKNFALFCKLDYCLPFKRNLMDSAKKSDDINIRESPKVAIYMMLTILIELEKRYGDLSQRIDMTWRRIGVEMAGLTRKPATLKSKEKKPKPTIGDTISNSLLNPDLLGKEWAVSECTVWFLEE